MINPRSEPAPEGDENVSSRYASFILRCWTGEGQPMRLRLVDVNSGTSHTLNDLSQLPGLLLALLRCH